MATRPRRSSIRRQPTLLRPLYQDFQPNSDMKENKEAHVLQIQLPGFTKERLRIEFEDSSRKLKVSGERPLDGANRRSRFSQAYSVPQNCNTAQIHSNFYQGILTITLPKKIISQEVKTAQEKIEDFKPPKSATAREESRDKKSVSSPSSSEKGREEASAQRAFEGPKPEKEVRAKIPSKVIRGEKGKEKNLQKPETTMAAAEKVGDGEPQKVQGEAEPQKVQGEAEPKPKLTLAPVKPKDEQGQEEIMQKPKIIMGQAPEKQRQKEIVLKPKITYAAPEKQTDDRTPKVQEETEPKLTLKMIPRKPTDGESPKVREEVVQKPKITMAATPDKQADGKLQKNEPKPEMGQEEIKHNTALTAFPKKQGDEKTGGRRDEDAEKERLSKEETKEAEGKTSELSASKIPQKGKENTSKAAAAGANEANRNDGMIQTIGKGIKEATSTVFPAYTRISEGKWDKEDKPLIVNIGASALVLAAAGIYAFYRLSSAGRT